MKIDQETIEDVKAALELLKRSDASANWLCGAASLLEEAAAKVRVAVQASTVKAEMLKS